MLDTRTQERGSRPNERAVHVMGWDSRAQQASFVSRADVDLLTYVMPSGEAVRDWGGRSATDAVGSSDL